MDSPSPYLSLKGEGDCSGLTLTLPLPQGRGDCSGVTLTLPLPQGRGDCSGLTLTLPLPQGRGDWALSGRKNRNLVASPLREKEIGVAFGRELAGVCLWSPPCLHKNGGSHRPDIPREVKLFYLSGGRVEAGKIGLAVLLLLSRAGYQRGLA